LTLIPFYRRYRSDFACFLLFFSLFICYYVHILIKGYNTDIPAHLVYVILYQKKIYIDVPHPVFIKMIIPIFMLFEKIRLDLLINQLGISITDMIRLFVGHLTDLGQNRIYIDLKDLPAIKSISTSSLVNLHLAGAFVIAFFAALNSSVIMRILKYFLSSKLNDRWLFFLTSILTFVTAIYVPFFNENVYVGQGSPNIWHSPTYLILKPFASCAFLLFILFAENARYRNSIFYAGLLSLTTALSALIKPNFVIVFMPAILIFLIIRFYGKISLYMKSFIVLLPTLCVLLYQYYTSYSSDKVAEGSIIISFFGVWKLYSPNIFFSILLGLAFPLSVLALRPINILKNNNFLLASWIMVIVGILQASFLAESGPRFKDWNFFWGYNIALHIIFIFSLIELASTADISGKVSEKIKVFFPIFLLFLHMISGGYYFSKIFFGGSFY
jgi:hypothetical protein